MLVSERCRDVLQQFVVPDHRAYPAEASLPFHHHARFGDQRSPYWLLHWLDDQWLDAIDLSRTALCITVRLMADRGRYHQLFPAGRFSSVGQVLEAASEFERQLPLSPGYAPPELPLQHGVKIVPETSPLPLKPFDLLWDPDGPIVVSKDLKQALLEAGFTGMNLDRPWKRPCVAAPDSQTQVRKARDAWLAERALASPIDPNAPIDAVFQAQQAKALALRTQARGSTLPRRTQTRPVGKEQALHKIEARLGVLFPQAYRAMLAGDTGDRITANLEVDEDNLTRKDPAYWDWLPLDELFTLDQLGDDGDWVTSCPHAMHALIVARDCGGDLLGFLLKEESLVELDDTLMHFKHETGEIVPANVEAWTLYDAGSLAPPDTFGSGLLGNIANAVWHRLRKN